MPFRRLGRALTVAGKASVATMAMLTFMTFAREAAAPTICFPAAGSPREGEETARMATVNFVNFTG